MQLYRAAILLIGLTLLTSAHAAPASKEANPAQPKPSPLTKVSQNVAIKPSESQPEKSEYSVPSSQLKQGDDLKPVALTQTSHSSKDFLAAETKKLGSKSDKATEKKLLKMLFDKKESTLIAPRTEANKHFSDQHQEYKSKSEHMLHEMRPDKHQKQQHEQQYDHALKSAKDAHHKESKEPKLGHFNVFKVQDPSKRSKRHRKPRHMNAKPRVYRRDVYGNKQDAPEAPWNYWKQPTDEMKVGRDEVTVERFHRPSVEKKRPNYEEENRYVPIEAEGRGHVSQQQWHRLPHHMNMGKEDEMRDFPVKSMHSFKGNYNPREFGFDSVFSPAYRPGGFGQESFGRMDHSRRMFAGGFQPDY